MAQTTISSTIEKVFDRCAMAIISISRPTHRTCPWLIQDDIPSRLSPLFLYDSAVPSSVFDENGVPATDSSFTGRVRQWRDLSGNDHHLEAVNPTRFDANNEVSYAPPTTIGFPLDSSLVATSNKRWTDGLSPKLEYTLSPTIKNQSFEFFFEGGFTEKPSDYASFFSSSDAFSTGYPFPDGGFQVYYLNDKIWIGISSEKKSYDFELAPFSTGDKQLHLRYDHDNNRTLEISFENKRIATQSGINITFYKFKLFTNRGGDAVSDSTIKFISVFSKVLSPSESEEYGAYQQCKWSAEIGKIIQQGTTDYTDIEPFTKSWSWVAQRIPAVPYERKISVLKAIVKPTIFGQNFTARLFLGTKDAPSGASLVTGAGGGIAEGYSNNISKAAQEIQFGKYDPKTNKASDFIDEAAVIPAGSYAWIAISSQTAWSMGYKPDFSSCAASFSGGGGNNTAPHSKGESWDKEDGRRYAITINAMRTT